MSYMGISRGPDTRTPEQQEAGKNIRMAYSVATGVPCGFYCVGCNEEVLFGNHKPDCKTGKILGEINLEGKP